jgi:hypothetical protein
MSVTKSMHIRTFTHKYSYLDGTVKFGIFHTTNTSCEFEIFYIEVLKKAHCQDIESFLQKLFYKAYDKDFKGDTLHHWCNTKGEKISPIATSPGPKKENKEFGTNETMSKEEQQEPLHKYGIAMRLRSSKKLWLVRFSENINELCSHLFQLSSYFVDGICNDEFKHRN